MTTSSNEAKTPLATDRVSKDIQLDAAQWQLIETAPKDGTPVVVLGVIFFGYEDDGRKQWSERDYSCVTNYKKDRQHLQQDEWCFVAPGIQTMIRARLWTPFPITQAGASPQERNSTTVTDKGSVQHEPELIRMLRLRKELDPDAPDAIVLPESESSTLVEIRKDLKRGTRPWYDTDIRTLLGIIDSLKAENKRWKAAVEGLTPSGSEYVDDPEACAAAIRERTRYPKQIIALRAEVESLRSAAPNMRDEIVKRVRAKVTGLHNQREELPREYKGKLDEAIIAVHSLANELEAIEVKDDPGG